MQSFKEHISKSVLPNVQKALGKSNVLAVPRIVKIVLGVGLNASSKEGKIQDVATSTLERITGQKAVITKARKSISGFKVREGMNVGLQITLRGKRMYDFLYKLINVTLPRMRDFRGISKKSVDANGHLTLGFKEHLVFPEIRSDEVEMLHGLQVTFVTSARKREDSVALFEALGFPFSK